MPAPRRRPHTDEVARVSIADLRRSIGPAWRSMTSVALNIGGAVTVVELLDLVGRKLTSAANPLESRHQLSGFVKYSVRIS